MPRHCAFNNLGKCKLDMKNMFLVDLVMIWSQFIIVLHTELPSPSKPGLREGLLECLCLRQRDLAITFLGHGTDLLIGLG